MFQLSGLRSPLPTFQCSHGDRPRCCDDEAASIMRDGDLPKPYGNTPESTGEGV